MTTRKQRTSGRFDLRALPISVKIALGLGIFTIMGAIATAQFVQKQVRDSQTQIALTDLETFSRAEAFRIMDSLSQEVTSLTQLGGSTPIQEELTLYSLGERSFIDGGPPLQTNELLTQQIIAFRETHSEFDAVGLISPEGYVLAIDPVLTDIEAVADAGSWLWFQTAMNDGEGQTHILNPLEDQLTFKTGIHITIPIYNERNSDEIIGVLYAIWNLSNTLDVVEIGGGREGIVAEPDGTVLISTREQRGDSLPSTLTSALQQGSEEGGSFIQTRTGNEEWLYGYTNIADLSTNDEAISNLGWFVVARQPLSAIEAASQELINQLIFTFGIGVSVTILLVLLFARSMLQPLERLTTAAIKIEAGDLTTPIPELPADDIGRLAQALDRLVTQLLRRVGQLNAAVQVSRVASLTLDVNEMLEDVATALTEQFSYSEARLYLSDPATRRLRLIAASGGESERMLKVGHNPPIDETTLIGRAILLGDVQLGGGEQQMRAAGLVTERAELALPLTSSGQILGVIYIFAGRNESFSDEDIDILHLIGDQVSSTIENARLFEQGAANLNEIEALNRQLTRQAWQEHIGDEGLRHTLDPEQRWPETLEIIRAKQEIKAEVHHDKDGRLILAAPLILRGETVGTLAVSRPSSERWSREEINLLEAVASRMAIVAESIRLVEESTEYAVREQKVNEISANLLQRAASVDNVLRSALDQLGSALGSDHLSLRIGPPPVDDDRLITRGHANPDEPTSNGNENEPSEV